MGQKGDKCVKMVQEFKKLYYEDKVSHLKVTDIARPQKKGCDLLVDR